MKLRLGLLVRDLSQRFNTLFQDFYTQFFIFVDRRYHITEYFQSFVYMPGLEIMLETAPKRHSLKPPRSLEIQSVT